MAPIKFEQNIREKLEKRTIKPSEMAWDKLSQDLDFQDENSKTPIAWWLGIAASLVGIFLIYTLFFNRTEEINFLPAVVENPIENNLEIQEVGTVINDIANTENITTEKTASSTIINKQNAIKEPINNVSFNQKSRIASQNIPEKDNTKNDANKSNSVVEKLNKQYIATQVPEIKNKKDLVNDIEIAALLQTAQKDLANNRYERETHLSVDSNTLLQDVELELEQSFRDKVFNTLISGYKTVRVAMAERNN